MAIDPKKLVALSRTGARNDDGFAPGAGEEHHLPGHPKGGGDDRSPEEKQRLRDADYMEIDEAAGGFSCGACTWAGEGEHCENPDVDAPVSADHGCCNLFFPAAGPPTWPPDAEEPR